MNDTGNLLELAAKGGPKTRTTPMPPREAFGDDEVAAVNAAMAYYRERRVDPPYQGHFEKTFCDAFVDFQGGEGYADAVATGTAACHIALAALGLPKGCDVLISPVTDSGPLNAIILQGYRPVVVDAQPGSFNIGPEQLAQRITENSLGLMAIHSGGEPLDMAAIMAVARDRGIKVVEDCSQAVGAESDGAKIGTFGDIAAFSTMYRKSLAAGASGGIVYTKDAELFHQALAHADRGKQVWRTDINQNDPGHALLPALNYNTDELSCAIGLASLKRLPDTLERRKEFVKCLVNRLTESSVACRAMPYHDGISPFFLTIFVDTDRLTVTKTEFALLLKAEGIDLNEHYGCLVSGWEWAEPYMSDQFKTINALKTQNSSFNLFLNEKYTASEADDVARAVQKVEAWVLKR